MTSHSSSFYNDFDPSASRWLDNLQRNNKIPKGVVSSMPITDIDEVGDYQYAHFFAGIGGWPLALQLAQLETDLKVWSGSCPCQPYSVAGKQKGTNDERDLWPVFNRLINKERPDLIFGEQVASAIRHGWLDRLTCDLEDDGYLVLSAVLSANLLGAPHERRRLFWGAIKQDLLENPNSFRHTWWCSLGDSSWCSGYIQEHCKERLSSSKSFWENGEWTEGTEGQRLLLEPRSFPLCNGVPYRLELLRGYGNAIVPQLGALFVTSFLDTTILAKL